MFADDFWLLTIDIFKTIDANNCCILRDLLRKGKVCVLKGRKIILSYALYAVVNEELQSQNDKEIDEEMEINETKIMEKKHGNGVPIKSSTKETMKMIAHNNSAKSSNTKRREDLSKLFKVYSGDSKNYSDVKTDKLDRKYTLFIERCDQSEVLTNDWASAFSIVQTDTTR